MSTKKSTAKAKLVHAIRKTFGDLKLKDSVFVINDYSINEHCVHGLKLSGIGKVDVHYGLGETITVSINETEAKREAPSTYSCAKIDAIRIFTTKEDMKQAAKVLLPEMIKIAEDRFNRANENTEICLIILDDLKTELAVIK